MSHAKAYTTLLELGQVAGVPMLCELTLTPIGSLGIIPGSFWTRLLRNLVSRPTTALAEERDSLLNSLQNVLKP